MKFENENHHLKKHLQLPYFLYALFFGSLIYWKNIELKRTTNIFRISEVLFALYCYITNIILLRNIKFTNFRLLLLQLYTYGMGITQIELLFKGIFQPRFLIKILQDIIKTEKILQTVKGPNVFRSIQFYVKFYFIIAFGPILCLTELIMLGKQFQSTHLLIGTSYLKICTTFFHSYYCCYTFVVARQFRDMRMILSQLKNSGNSVFKEIFLIQMIIEEHRNLTCVWRGLNRYFEFSILMHVVSFSCNIFVIVNTIYQQLERDGDISLDKWVSLIFAMYKLLLFCIVCTEAENQVS